MTQVHLMPYDNNLALKQTTYSLLTDPELPPPILEWQFYAPTLDTIKANPHMLLLTMMNRVVHGVWPTDPADPEDTETEHFIAWATDKHLILSHVHRTTS